MKIIHCSDLHFDSRMETHLSYRKAQERNNEILTTFGRMAEFARKEGVRLILIAGDVFDAQRITSKSAGYFLDVVEASPEVDFLLLRGNHDGSRRAFAGRRIPENLRLFCDQWTYCDYGEVTVAGAELTERNCRSLFAELRLSPARTNLVLLHGQIGGQFGAERIPLPALRNRQIHYLALGHLHSYESGKLDESGIYVYSGCLEGRGFDECGEKGFVLLEAGKQRVDHVFLPFARRALEDISVDISGLDTVGEILARMNEAAAQIHRDSLVRFRLRGSYAPGAQKDLRFLRQALEERFYFVRITDESRLAMEKDSYARDISLKGEFIRSVLASDLGEEEKERIIGAGLAALAGEEIVV